VLRLGGVPSAVRLSGDDTLCAVVTGEQAAVYDFGTARQTARLTGHTSAITDAAVSGDAASVLTVGEDATLRLWSARTGAPGLRVQQRASLSDPRTTMACHAAVGMCRLDDTARHNSAPLHCR
jgi:WD40 repeat protein